MTTVYDPFDARRANADRLSKVIYLLFALVEGLLLIRFVLRALGASPEASFAQGIYGITGVLVAPFAGLFGTPQGAGGATLEVHTLVALVVYAGVGWLLVRAAALAFGEGRSARVTSATSEQTRVG